MQEFFKKERGWGGGGSGTSKRLARRNFQFASQIQTADERGVYIGTFCTKRVCVCGGGAWCMGRPLPAHPPTHPPTFTVLMPLPWCTYLHDLPSHFSVFSVLHTTSIPPIVTFCYIGNLTCDIPHRVCCARAILSWEMRQVFPDKPPYKAIMI